MRGRTSLACLVGAALVWLHVPSALAQEARCSAAEAGTVACIAGKLCGCLFARGSPATGLPDGYRWDCGILRPSCGASAPATIDPWQNGLPDALAIDGAHRFRPARPMAPGRLPPG